MLLLQTFSSSFTIFHPPALYLAGSKKALSHVDLSPPKPTLLPTPDLPYAGNRFPRLICSPYAACPVSSNDIMQQHSAGAIINPSYHALLQQCKDLQCAVAKLELEKREMQDTIHALRQKETCSKSSTSCVAGLCVAQQGIKAFATLGSICRATRDGQ